MKLSSYRRNKNNLYRLCLAYLIAEDDEEYGVSLWKQVFHPGATG